MLADSMPVTLLALIAPTTMLADSRPVTLLALIAPLPVLWITGCLSTASKSDKNMYYDAPLYKAPKRTGLNFISSVQLRTEEQPQKWTLRGVALLATID